MSADADAGADGVGNFVSANSPVKSFTSFERYPNTDIDISPQSYNQELKSSETYSTSLGLQQSLDRNLTPASTEKDRHTHQIRFHPSNAQVNASSYSSRTRAMNDSADFRIFLIRPSVQDREGTVQVSWNTTETNMQQSEIRKQLAQYERENQPSVLDTLESLRAYERSVIEGINDHGNFSADRPRYELIALKRTWTTISHRQMVFQGLPGLRFVIQQVPSQNQSLGKNIVEPGATAAITKFNDIPRIVAHRHRRIDRSLERLAEAPCDEGHIISNPSFREGHTRGRGRLVENESAAPEETPRVVRVISVSRGLSSKDEPINDAEEEQVVAELLGKYTTLYE